MPGGLRDKRVAMERDSVGRALPTTALLSLWLTLGVAAQERGPRHQKTR